MRAGWIIGLKAILFLMLSMASLPLAQADIAGDGTRKVALITGHEKSTHKDEPQQARKAETGPELLEGRFGKALNAHSGPAFAPARADYARPPITVECWARIHSKNAYNILIASENRSSATHWEMFTMLQSGYFTVSMPGMTPDQVRTTRDICDDKWHYLAMVFTAGRIQLFVDGVSVADQPVQFNNGTRQPGEIAFGTLVSHEFGCDGLLDDLRISQAALDINTVPTSPLPVEDATLGLWRFDTLEQGRLPDIGRLLNPAHLLTAVETVVEKNPPPADPMPVIDRRKTVEWRNVGNDKGGMRYSPLQQINQKNVKNLKVAWTYRCGDGTSGSTIECTPIMVDGVLYLTTPRLKIVALDAATGREIWVYDPHSGGVNRGVAYWSDGKSNGQRRILMGTPDGRLLSLDARTGEPDKAFGKAGTVDLRLGLGRNVAGMTYGVTSAPAVFENLVFPGILNAEGQPGAPGDIRAFDIRTGREVWRFATVPGPGEFGHDTWEGDSWKNRSGVNPWAGFTLDEKRGILFCGTGSAASDFYGTDRKGANLFANSTLALDARIGKRLWHFQVVHHDLWDHDIPCPPVMVTVRRNGKNVDAVAQPTKTGYCYLFDRLTGKPLFEVREEPAPPSDIPGESAWPTQPYPVKPPPFSPNRFTAEDVTNISPEAHAAVMQMLSKLNYGKVHLPPSVAGTVVLPGFHGGSNWSGASFDPTTNTLYVNSNNVPYISVLRPNANGGYDFGGYTYFNDPNGYPANKPPWGSLTAIDLNKGEFAWQVRLGEFPELTSKGVPITGTENFGGTIVTSGGLVFIGGTKDEKFHAFDKATGTMLWDYHLPAGGYSTPSTYMVNGRQYVVIAAGGGGKLRTKSGDTYIAFALPDEGK